MSITNQSVRLVAVALALMLLSVDAATAQKPPKPGDGGGEPTAAELNPAIAFVSTQTSGRNAGRQDVVVASADLASEIVLCGTIQS